MLHNQYDIVIIGAGPAGLIAAIESCQPHKKILILEKMHKPALKLRLSGKGRCNITNDADIKDFLSHFGKNGRFLKFAFNQFFNRDLIEYFQKLGVNFKLERGGRYFPENDSAMEVVKVLLNKVKSLNITIATNSEISGLTQLPDKKFIITANKKTNIDDKKDQWIKIKSAIVVLATGGKSYPKTGSSGTGFNLASQLGHTITPLAPALVPVETKGDISKRLQGLILKNVKAAVWCNNKKVKELFGEMSFTNHSISGPIILSLSKTIVKLIDEKMKVSISIDLKPALSHTKVDQRLLREINEHNKQSFKNLLKGLLPKKLIPLFIDLVKIPEEKQLNQISSEERKNIRRLLKEFRLEVTGYRSFDEAIVTSGGICINEINNHTMESKIVKGLYLAGEIIDIDADTGGYNLQAAFSTGWVAGRAINSL